MNALGEIYFVDDTTIRKIGLDGKIDTVIGSQDLPGQYVPMPCGRAADLYEVSLINFYQGKKKSIYSVYGASHRTDNLMGVSQQILKLVLKFCMRRYLISLISLTPNTRKILVRFRAQKGMISILPCIFRCSWAGRLV